MNPALQELLQIRNCSEDARLTLTGSDPIYPTHYRVAETGAAVLGAVGVAVSDIWAMKTGRRQAVTVDTRAAAAALRSFAYLQRREADGSFQTLGNSAAAADAYQLIQPFRTKDGRWLLPHFGITHLKERMLKLLGCEPRPDCVAAAIARWDAQALEDAIADIGACGGMLRSHAQWRQHSQGQILAAQPVVQIEKIGESAPEPFPTSGPPLAGVRVLDLTRILAGPVAARACAEQGAEVLMVGAKGVPQIKNFVIDLSHGKRSCFLDLKRSDQAEQLRTLVRSADVFSQGYRPGVLAARGFGPQELAAVRPGLIYTSISCYGPEGPFSARAGWEQVAQSVIGICADSGTDQPELLPVPACDYLTGYLGAYGILLALARRATEGGSYHVNVSLCRSGMLVHDQGRVAVADRDHDVHGLTDAEVRQWQMQSSTPYGELRHLAPAIQYSDTTPQWTRPTPALGADKPQWLDA
jgi:crotonobetainyl-CoA:carnitine CoA-transferase CaiB-like acyl-CoA transferase